MTDLKQAITRLIEAAHRGSELLDGCPDDSVAAAASTELSEAAAAVDRLLLIEKPATTPSRAGMDEQGRSSCLAAELEADDTHDPDAPPRPVSQADEE
jgi:hypothetical protein